MKDIRNTSALLDAGLRAFSSSRKWLCGLLMLFHTLQAHEVHTSSAEVEYNAKSQKLEVSLTVFVDDLELALMRHSERLMSLEKTPASELDAQIQAYLGKTFIVTEVTGKTAKIEWVGRETEDAKTDAPTVTLFFEVPLVACLSGVTLRHEVFCDLFKDQLNLLHLRRGAQSLALQFSRELASHSIELAE
jgi:hypothetical protein